jgi:hypothetical protein
MNGQATMRHRRNRFTLTIESHLGGCDESESFVKSAPFVGSMEHEGIDPFLAGPIDDPLY